MFHNTRQYLPTCPCPHGAHFLYSALRMLLWPLYGHFIYTPFNAAWLTKGCQKRFMESTRPYLIENTDMIDFSFGTWIPECHEQDVKCLIRSIQLENGNMIYCFSSFFGAYLINIYQAFRQQNAFCWLESFFMSQQAAKTTPPNMLLKYPTEDKIHSLCSV